MNSVKPSMIAIAKKIERCRYSKTTDIIKSTQVPSNINAPIASCGSPVVNGYSGENCPWIVNMSSLTITNNAMSAAPPMVSPIRSTTPRIAE